MDLLHAHAAEVEREVFFRVSDLFNLEVDLIFYDTTTAAFAIDDPDEADAEGEGLRRYGRPRSGAWNPQVVIALAVTRQGLPVRSWVFPGNTTDVTTVKRVKEDLKGWKLGRALFVADSGANSLDNRRALAAACGTYLLATRMGSVSEVKDDVLRRPGRYRHIADNLKAKEVMVGAGVRRRRYIVCYNPEEEKRQRLHRAQVLRELEQELADHRSLDANQSWVVALRASQRYGRYLKVDSDRRVSIDRAAARAAERHDGKWVLITNDDTLTVEDAATGYKGLQVIERCFRALKQTRIQVTPMHHWVRRRIEAHVKICTLALLISRTAELAAGQPWERIRQELRRVQATEFAAGAYHFHQRNELEPSMLKLLQVLQIQGPKRILAVSKAS
jgi:transposase